MIRPRGVGLDVPALLFHHKVSVSQLESTMHGKILQVICKPEGGDYILQISFQEALLFRFGIPVNGTG